MQLTVPTHFYREVSNSPLPQGGVRNLKQAAYPKVSDRIVEPLTDETQLVEEFRIIGRFSRTGSESPSNGSRCSVYPFAT